MPLPGKTWRHVIINTLCTWLHGDSRGFRSRGHEIHSSGDYKNPPPAHEHEGLRRWMRNRARAEVHIPHEMRSVVGKMILHDLQEQSHRVIAVATDKVHTHALVELPTDLHQVRDIIGQAKRKSSRAVKTKLPGKIWAAGGTFKRVNDRDHLDAAHDYIIYDQGDEAWTWSFRDPSDEGMFKRQRSPEE